MKKTDGGISFEAAGRFLRKTISALLCALLALCSCGCDLSEIINDALSSAALSLAAQSQESEESRQSEGSRQKEESRQSGRSPRFTYVPDGNFKNAAEKNAAAIVDEAISYAYDILADTEVTVIKSEKHGFDFTDRRSELSDFRREIYDTIYGAVSSYSQYKFDTSEYSSDFFEDFMTADMAVKSDHPELFLYYYPNVLTDVYVPMYFLPGYSFEEPIGTIPEIKEAVELFDAACGRICANMPEGLSVYDQYRYLSVVICRLCTFDKSLKTTGLPYPAYNAIINGTSVCSGFSVALTHLCRLCDLWCETVYCKAEGQPHMYNRVMLGGRTYYIDLTWADRADPAGYAWHCNFMMTQKEAEEGSHVNIDGSVATGTPLPPPYDRYQADRRAG